MINTFKSKVILYPAVLFFMGLIPVPLLAQNFNSELYLQTSEVNNTMIHYDADKGSIMRFYSTNSNQDTFGVQNEEDKYNTPERRARRLELIASYKKELQGLNYDAMSNNGKVDYILFNRNLNSEEYELQQQQKTYDRIKIYFPFDEKIYALEKPRRRGIKVNGAEAAKELEDLRKAINEEIKKFSKIDGLDKTASEFAVLHAKGLQDILKNYFDFYNGYDPLFSWWVPKTYSEVDSALGEYAVLIKSKRKDSSTQKEDGSGIVGNPIGREELIRQLQTEFIPYSPEELVAIANKEFAWCDAELLKASREMGFGDNWKAAQEKVKNSYVAPGDQPQAMLDLYNQSVEFLKKNNLLTIPPIAEETWRMYMMSPEAQKINPFFLGGESLIISYPTSSMSYSEKMMSMRGNNPNFSRATIHHELIAGHHLQQFMRDRYKAYRHFDTPFWVEGNSLYWEMLLWDLKFPQTPQDKIGMLFWRMHRCARIIFSLNYHLGKWTPQQCIDFLVDRVGHERANAEGEVRRSFVGGYSPLYQIAYMLGGLQFTALKEELVTSGKMSYLEYHDAILRENAMPIELLRALLTNQPLQRDFKTSWKFYKF
ncbi:DUF885 family protein [Flavobacterium sp. MC2016-06]|uniref:DUF885 family protein n=1 Tax=Flavobacterium sp. MC2016-06 TaxID=2676308 RepID=UPI0012BAA53C|nr:DUF885 family protein [Flavobacterium sp. MC2016-06]MBU3860314.1 DUF885 domain-containing protein [Flavobacterium sp. MC2016-06]